MNNEPQVEATVAPPASPSTMAILGLALLAIIGHLALLDAAVETFWNGSPLRWSVVPVTLAFLALSLWMWRPGGKLLRRFGPGGAATTSVGGLLALLAATAWLPGGQVDGVRLLLQQTPTVLTLASLMAVLLATLVIVQVLVSVPPRARLIARAVFILLCAYAVFALAVALREHTAYSALFQGDAVWSRLPSWLQGTSIGVLGLVPLAIVAQAMRLVGHLRRTQSLRVLSRQALALVLAFAMSLSGVSIPRAVPTSPHVTAAALWRPRADQLDKVFQALDAAKANLDRTTFDPGAVVDKVGKNPDALFEWLRDNTYWVPYRGALRGPVAVLMDRLGNSLDRSLLLGALLQAAGQEVRLAHAQMPPGVATSLRARLRAVPPAPRPEPPNMEQAATAVDQFARANGLDAAGMRQNLNAVTPRWNAMAAEVARRVADQTGMIIQTLGPLPASEPADDTLAALADHWWIQRREGDGWIDLDPLLPDAKSGVSLVPAEETFDLRGAAGEIPLDARFCQELEIRVVAEQWKAGELSETVALAHTLRPADVFGQAVAIQQVPLQWPVGRDIGKEEDPVGQLRANLAKVTEWVPVLKVGDAVITQSSILKNGDVNTNPRLGGGGIASPVSGLGGGLWGGISGGGDEEPGSHAQLTAEWIDYVFRVPGEAPRSIRRELFDLLGPAARQAAKAGASPKSIGTPGVHLLDRVDVLIQVARYSSDFLFDSIARRILDARPAILALSTTRSDPSRAVELVRELTPMSPALLNVAVGRFAGERPSGDVYLDCPNVLTYRTGLRFDTTGPVFEALFDIVNNSVAVSASHPNAQASFRARVEQGVRDTTVEGLFPPEFHLGGSTATIFAQAASDGVRSLLVRGTDGVALAGLGLPPDAAVRMREVLAEGHLLVVPAHPVKVGGVPRMAWYRVNPATGDTVGVLDTGFNGGQGDSAEYATTVKRVAVDTVAAPAVVAPAAAESALHSMWIDFLFWLFEGSHAFQVTCYGVSALLLGFTAWVLWGD